jgi:hypothetical protein
LIVRNNPRKAFFVPRRTAQGVHGSITFFDDRGQRVSEKDMPIRWDGAPEPLKYDVRNGQVEILPDPKLVRVSRFIDIYPDEKESLSPAVKIEGEDKAYGWTSESYFEEWRHPDFELPEGDYVARVSLKCGDQLVEEDFRFSNPTEFTNFDLS